jgi:putative oxidoreductase
VLARLLIGFLVPVTLMMHGLWRLHDPQVVHIQQAMCLKNVALVGGALLLAQTGSGF